MKKSLLFFFALLSALAVSAQETVSDMVDGYCFDGMTSSVFNTYWYTADSGTEYVFHGRSYQGKNGLRLGDSNTIMCYLFNSTSVGYIRSISIQGYNQASNTSGTLYVYGSDTPFELNDDEDKWPDYSFATQLGTVSFQTVAGTDKLEIEGNYPYVILLNNKSGSVSTYDHVTFEWEVVDNGSGTADDPYTASYAYSYASSLDSETTISGIYVKGIISQIDEVSTSYGNATYYITDDGTVADNQLEIYRGYSLGGVKFTAEDEIKVGDEVIVRGDLVNYKGNTPEITTGSSIYSLNGETYGSPGGSGDGINVSGSVITLTNDALTESTETASIVFSTLGFEDAQSVDGVAIPVDDYTTITFAKDIGSTDPKYFDINTAIRMYADNTMTISSTKPIAKVVMNCASSSYTGNETATVEFINAGYEIVYCNLYSATSGGTQVRVQDIVITYAEEEEEEQPVGEGGVSINGKVVTLTNVNLDAIEETASIDLTAQGYADGYSLRDVPIAIDEYTTLTFGSSSANQVPTYSTADPSVRVGGSQFFNIESSKPIAKVVLNCLSSTYTGSYSPDVTFTVYRIDYTNTTIDGDSRQLRVQTIEITYAEEPPAYGLGTADDPYIASYAYEYASTLDADATIEGVYIKGIISQIDEVNTADGDATYYITDDGAVADDQLEIYHGYSLGGVKFMVEDEIKVGDEVVVYGNLVNYEGSTPEVAQGSSIYSLNGELYHETGWNGDGISVSGRYIILTNDALTEGTETASIVFSEQGYLAVEAVAAGTPIDDYTTITFDHGEGRSYPYYYDDPDASVRMHADNTLTFNSIRPIARVVMTCSTEDYTGNETATVEFADSDTGFEIVYCNYYTDTSGGTSVRIQSITIYYTEEEEHEFIELKTDVELTTLAGETTYYEYTPATDGKLIISQENLRTVKIYADASLWRELYNETYWSDAFDFSYDMTGGTTYYIVAIASTTRDAVYTAKYEAVWTANDPNFTFDPADGEYVESLSTITVGYTDEVVSANYMGFDYGDVVVYRDGEKVSMTFSNSNFDEESVENCVVVKLPKEQTEDGTYTIIFPRRTFALTTGIGDGNIVIIDEEVHLTYYIGDVPEGIEQIGAAGVDGNYSNGAIYTLTGQKVSAPTAKGIYIINGKKVYIK